MNELPAYAILIFSIIIFSALLGIILLAFDVLHAATHPDHRSFSQRVKDRWITDDIYQ